LSVPYPAVSAKTDNIAHPTVPLYPVPWKIQALFRSCPVCKAFRLPQTWEWQNPQTSKIPQTSEVFKTSEVFLNWAIRLIRLFHYIHTSEVFKTLESCCTETSEVFKISEVFLNCKAFRLPQTWEWQTSEVFKTLENC